MPVRKAGGDLGMRIVVGILLAAIAIAAIWFGGWSFTLLIAAATMLAFREWSALTAIGRPWYSIGLILIAAIVVTTAIARPFEALLALCGAILLLSLLARTIWLGAGLSYAAMPAIALVWLREQPDGMALVLWTLALVWMTDICAYFAGRGIGGPKIWPAVSPSKTWAGLGGGMVGAAGFSALFAMAMAWQHPALYGLIGAILAIVAQAGDFFESWLKRRAGVKDSGNLLPGHGGVLDRIDGLVPVAICVALWVALT